MSVTNGERLVTKQDLADFYDNIRPYMGGLVTSKAGFTPIGTIISVMGTTAPVNYLACDGTVYNIADYVELANYFNEQFGSKNFFGGDGTTTFAVPDLRGEFLRGTGTNSHENQGSGENVGVHQDGTIQTWTGGESGQVRSPMEVISNADFDYTGLANTGTYLQNAGTGAYYKKYTSRPTNTSVLYCIATKNFYIDPTLDYSTDEKIVGTWIDSKPIYQRVIPLTLPTQAGAQSLNSNVDVSNIEKYIDCKIIAISADNHTYFLPTIHSDASTYQITPFNFGKKSNVNPTFYVYFSYLGTAEYNNANYKIAEIYAVLQYTKTTT